MKRQSTFAIRTVHKCGATKRFFKFSTAMKGRKAAFTNTSTGYGKQKHTFNRNSTKNERESTSKHAGKPEEKVLPDGSDDKKTEQDKDLNSGFGDYLRTTEAFEMMKLFVFANTIMLIVTMAWPHIREQFFMLNEWWESFQHQ